MWHYQTLEVRSARSAWDMMRYLGDEGLECSIPTNVAFSICQLMLSHGARRMLRERGSKEEDHFSFRADVSSFFREVFDAEQRRILQSLFALSEGSSQPTQSSSFFSTFWGRIRGINN